MNLPKLIILDFDRVIFNHNLFYDDCLFVLHDQKVITAAQYERLEQQLYSLDISFDILASSVKLGLDPDKVERLIETSMSAKTYYYDDVAEFLWRHEKQQVLIITTGRREEQKLKLNLCPIIKPYVHIIIPGNKGTYLANSLVQDKAGITIKSFINQKFGEVWLVDDRPDNLLPLKSCPGIKLFHLQRPDAKYVRERDYVWARHVSSLEEAQ